MLIYFLRKHVRVHIQKPFLFFLCVYLNKDVSEVKEVCRTSVNNSLFLLSLVILGKKNFVSSWV